MIGIPIAFAAFGYAEWAMHKYAFHGLGRKRTSVFSFHYHEHHQAVRRNGFYDAAYEGPVWTTPTQFREAVGLLAVGAAHLPLFPIAPFYTTTFWYCLWRYRRDHRRAHLDPDWARDHLPCHYDHHMGDQDQNFAICWPWVDNLTGTRVAFVGSDKEVAQRAMQAERAKKAKAGAAERALRHKTFAQFVTRTVTRRLVKATRAQVAERRRGVAGDDAARPL